MKHLKTIKTEDNLEGFLDILKKGRIIYVNVESLWKEAVKKSKRTGKSPEDLFCKQFINTFIHEELHYVIKQNYKPYKKWLYGEELIIWRLLNERMSKEVKEYYKTELG